MRHRQNFAADFKEILKNFRKISCKLWRSFENFKLILMGRGRNLRKILKTFNKTCA